MKNVILAARLISKRIGIALLLVFQMLLSILVLVTLVGKLQGIAASGYVTDAFKNPNSFYILLHSYNFTVSRRQLTDEFYSKAASVDGVQGIGEIKDVPFLLDLDYEQGYYTCLAYNKEIIQNLNMPMAQGEWLDTAQTNGTVPIVSVGSKYKLHEIIPFYIPSEEGSPPTQYQGEVVGILPSGSYIATFMAGGNSNNSSLSDLLSTADNCLLAALESFPKDAAKNFSDQSGKIVFGSEGISADYVAQELRDFGYVTDVKALQDNYNKEISDFLTTNGIVFLFFALLVLAGIGGNNGIQNIENEKKFTIYYILGVSPARCAVVEAIRSFILIGVTFVLSIIAYQFEFIQKLVASNGSLVNTTTFLIVLLYLLLVYAVTSGWFIIKLATGNPMELYRKKD